MSFKKLALRLTPEWFVKNAAVSQDATDDGAVVGDGHYMYTVGNPSVYDPPLFMGYVFKKLGRTEDYQGGILFTSVEAARQFTEADCRYHGFDVYALRVRPGDVAFEDGHHWLLNSTQLELLTAANAG